MAPRNDRVNPETEVRSPARSFLNSLDNFYQAPARDARGERAFENGINSFGSMIEERANAAKAEQRQNLHTQGVQDALREEAGQELHGVKTGSIFRQHSKFYMMGLNETRGKAAGARFKADTALAYQEWDGRHIDDDGTAFRSWMNDRVATFVGELGDDPNRVNGALPVINEVAANFATQHTAFTSSRLEQESFDAYDEIVSGVFTDLANGELELEMAVDAIAFEANEMYNTDGAKANDRVVDAALRYASIHDDPEAILVLGNAHQSGKLKLSQINRDKLADGMDRVEAEIARKTSLQSAKEVSDSKARKANLQQEWYAELQRDPYADIGAWTAANQVEGEFFGALNTLQEAFIRGANVENPAITSGQRMNLERDLYNATTAEERLRVFTEFTRSNPTAMGSADVAKYMKEIFAYADPGSIINDQTVGKFRDGFGQTLAEFQNGDGFDINRSSHMRTQGVMHFDSYMLLQAGKIDMSDPAALYTAIKEAKAFAMEQLAYDFPEVLREKNDQSTLGRSLGVDEALETTDAVRTQEAAANYARLAGIENFADFEEDAAFDGQQRGQLGPEVQPEDFDPNAIDPTTGEGADLNTPAREGFYGELIHRFTDGVDSREKLEVAIKAINEDPEFKEAVENLADKYSVPAAALLAVMDFETGGTFDTAELNKAGSGATGLIQFMPETARSLGTTVEHLATLSRKEQMVYVEKYLDQYANRIRGGQVDDIYMAVLWPRAIGKEDGYPIFRAGTEAYNQNKGLDTNKDGTVTKFEAAAKVKAKFYGY